MSQAELQTTDVAARPEEKPEAEAEPAPPPHTPITRVSPLLRPASRLRMPRHSARHPREESVQEVLPAATPSVPEAPTTSPSLQQPAEQPAEPVVEQPRPARRYRFDRPAASSSTTSTTRTGTPTQSGTSPSSPQVRSEESRDKETTQSRGGASQFGSFSRQESSRQETTTPQSDQGNQPSAKTSIGANNQTQEQPAQRFAVAQEQTSSESVSTTTSESNESGRRRHHQERQQKEHQVANITPIVAPQPVAEIVMPAEITQAESVSPEDLPPLEYADLQKASPRRRRRHRSGSTTGNGASIAQGTPEAPAAQVPMLSATPAPAPAPAPAANVPDERSIAGSNSSVNPFSIVSGYTVSQMNQGNEVTGPFMGPEPSPARGSVVSRDGRTIRAEMQRSSAYPPVARTTHEGGVSSSSLNHLANVVSQSIQQSIQLQTDRMVAEMRRANQAPTSVSVSLPPFPSTERVGVFVDVANLLYSARTLRIAVDFGKLLDFLRGNRRLVRAHAYCPTSPQAGDEQMFLQAVKGLGYRITTKNYKTFSSGAKKADLDLDLCMDVVRLVDGRAVDCIVLVSGDSDFMPMLDYCSDHGVRVEVAAFDEAMSATLRQSCDLFVNLSMLE
ncbi:MAG TPA: NYN domain-containing protein, partial [Ktedonobacteraceae bacterium]